MANHKEQTMTKGNIWKQIIWFSVPLLIGNLFQQLYNTTDSVIVGNFVGKEALAAAALLAFLVMLFSIFHSSSIYLRSHYYRIQFAGIILPAYAVLSLLIKKYDCDVVPSLLMVLGGLFLPLLILMWLISLFH